MTHAPSRFAEDRRKPLPSVASERGAILRRLDGRSIVLVGMMGAGKTSIGRRLAQQLGLAFVDADHEIEAAAQLTIAEIFARHGEAFFRDGEARVISRLLAEGQRVVATGGGAYMRADTRARIAERGLAIWLQADVPVLLRRVRKRTNRPLLATDDQEATLLRLLREREPIYALADLAVRSHDGPYDDVVADMLAALMGRAKSVGGDVRHGARGPTPVAVVPVELGARRYDIRIGPDLLAGAGAAIAARAPGAACAIVTDRHVAALHLEPLRESLAAAGLRPSSIVVEPGEGSKSLAVYGTVCDALLDARLERRDLVVALGGGVVGDLAGFAAATLKRGLDFVQVPTSLLAQVDSSVGGKTGLNARAGKNLIGAFHQPCLVLADTDVLETLPAREFRAGYAEMAKYGLIDDAPFFAWLEQNRAAIFAHGPELAEAVRISCTAKAAIVARDETEQGDRALLNLGHTFAHAFERLTLYDGTRLVHGEAVAIGLACAFRFSARLGLAPAADAVRVARHLAEAGLPTRIGAIHGLNADADALLDAMAQDKKVERGALTFILAHGIGRSFIAKGIAAADVRSFLNDELTET